MFKIKKLIFLLLAITVFSGEMFAGGSNRAGTAAAPELRIPLGARYLAMSGASIASVQGLESIYWNPAGLDLTKSSANALFSNRSYIADMNMNFVAVSGRFGNFGSLGLSFRNLNVGDINVTTMDQPDGTGQIITPTYFVLGLTYSKKLTDRISVGVNLNFISEGFDRVKSSGFGIDFGVQYSDLFSVPNFDLGIAVKNLGGSMKYGGNALFKTATDPSSQRGPTYYEFDPQASDLPSEIAIGLSYSKNLDASNKLLVAAAFQNNNFTYDDYKVGLEYSYDDMFFVRGGYLYSPQATTSAPNIFQNYTFGAGINLNKLSNVDISVDYAYVPVKYFTANNVFSVRVGF